MNKMATARPLAATKTYTVLAEDLRQAGVEAAFGLMSDDTALLITALESTGVRFFNTRHENNGVVMAEGYGKAADTLGVAIIGRGPGAANCINALVHVSRTGTPTLIIVGDQPRGARNVRNAGGPDLKWLDAERLFAATGIQTVVATSSRTARVVLADAIAEARLGQTVIYLLPTDVMAAPADAAEAPVRPVPARKPASARPAAVALAQKLLDQARYPLIVAGDGAVRADAREPLLQLAEKTGALVLTSLRAKDFFAGSPYNLKISGSFSHATARRYVEKADCVISLGAALTILSSSFGEFFPHVPLIHVDDDRRNIGRYCYADVSLVGDARAVTEQLLAATQDKPAGDKPYHAKEVLKDIASFDYSQEFSTSHTDYAVDMRTLALRIDQLIPTDRDVVFDLGNFFLIAPYITVPGPRHYRYTDQFASIGLGMGTALGMAAANRGRPAFLFIGDGSLFMTLGELETVAREDLPLIIFVFNDHAYGAESHHLTLRNQPIGKSVFPDTDFAPVAENFGIESQTVRSMKELEALAPVLQAASGPLLIDCKINPDTVAGFLGEFARLEGY
jgi:acetolactate synthase I/II/III large subunit